MSPTVRGPAICLMIGGAVALGLPDDQVAAHPHVWIDAAATFVFEDGMLVGLRHRWAFDELFSSFVIEEHDANGDGVFDETESRAVREQAFSNLREYDYFTHVRLDGAPLPLKEITDFTVQNDDGVLVYTFTMPLPAPIAPGVDRFAAGVYDPNIMSRSCSTSSIRSASRASRAAPAPSTSERTPSIRSITAWSIR